MAKDQFKLPPVSPLMGSTYPVYRQTFKGTQIDPQFNTKERITAAIIHLTAPFRWYENAFITPRARKAMPEQLVFIIGHWRGGTTFLHNLLCRAKDATFVSTYQTVFPNFMGSQGFFRPFMRALMPDRRPSDNVKLNVDFPQEEEFAFSGVCANNYYRFMYFPKHYARFYDQSVRLNNLSDDDLRDFEAKYRDVLHKAHWSRPGRVMFVKNPVHTARLKWLSRAFPQAKFIHIYRNPYTVYRSTLKFFTELLPTLWFEEVSDEFIQNMVLETYVKLYSDFDSALKDLPDLPLSEVRFEDFETDPVGHVEQLYKELELGDFEASRSEFEQYVASKRSFKKNEYSFPEDLIDTVDKHWGEYVRRWGYSVPG